VDGAAVKGATTDLSLAGAFAATEAGAQEGTVTGLDTTAAGLGARGVEGEIADDAVDRARLEGTAALGGERITFLATEFGGDADTPDAGGPATATGLGAWSPLAPASETAVDGACLAFAKTDPDGGAAPLATVLASGEGLAV